MKSKTTLLIVIWLFVLINLNCKKLADAEAPYTSINEKNVYESDATAIAVLTGLYGNTSFQNYFAGQSGLSLVAGLSADELTLYDGTNLLMQRAYYTNTLVSNSLQSFGSEFWSIFYYYVFTCNAAIEGLTAAVELTPAIQQQLLGEAKFMRAFYYFYLVALYGDVPLITSTNFSKNATLPRVSKDEVYRKMISDLKQAQETLSNNYLEADLLSVTKERVRPTKWAATALLARTYMYMKDWINAELQATMIIQEAGMFNLLPLNEVFLKNSRESIWQLQTLNTDHNTEDAWTFVIPSTGPDDAHPAYLSPQLLNSFETGDLRRNNWVDSVRTSSATWHYPFKYKSATLNAPLTEYLTVLRLGEQYLIRAEARAEQGNLTGAAADLNIIRARAGLPNTKATTQTQLLNAIQKERRVELFTEWANRWLDMKRTNKIDDVMATVTPLKGGTWESGDKLYPLPFSDIRKDPNLIQNPNY